MRHFLITKHKKDRTIYNYILRLLWSVASSALPRRLMTHSSVPTCQLGHTVHLHQRLSTRVRIVSWTIGDRSSKYYFIVHANVYMTRDNPKFVFLKPCYTTCWPRVKHWFRSIDRCFPNVTPTSLDKREKSEFQKKKKRLSTFRRLCEM